MSPRNRYFVKETLISVAINTGLSVGFVLLVFHGESRIAVGGSHGVIVDMAPQTFMVTLMSCLVPGLLTRSRHQSGKLAWHRETMNLAAARIWLRAVLAALLATCIVVACSWAILPQLLSGGISFGALVTDKALFGMVLAAVVTPWAISKVLAQKHSSIATNGL